MTVKKRSGLSSEKRVNRVPVGKASPKATGRINQFFDQTPVAINTSLRVLTSFNLVRGGGRRGSAAREKLVKKSLVEQDREISREELHQLVWSKPIGTPNWKILPNNPKMPAKIKRSIQPNERLLSAASDSLTGIETKADGDGSGSRHPNKSSSNQISTFG